MVIKLRSELRGQHVREAVFGGPDREHLALLGNLTMNIGEWQLFGAALLMGAKQTKGHLTVILEGDQEVVRALEIQPETAGVL